MAQTSAVESIGNHPQRGDRHLGFNTTRPTLLSPTRGTVQDSARITSSACCKSSGNGASKRISVPVAGCSKARLAACSHWRLEPESLGQHRVGAVGQVADTGVADRGHVHPDLMRASGLEVDIQQRRRPERLGRLVVGDARPPPGDHGELVVGAVMAPDRRIDRPAARIGMTLDEGGVPLIDGPIAKRPLERRIGPLALGHHHDPGRADVEAVHDTLPFGRPGRRDPVAQRGQPADDRRARPPWAWMRGDADRLVDRDQVVVVVDHGQTRRRFGRAGAGIPGRRLGQRHLDPRAFVNLGRPGGHLAVDQHLTGIDEVGGSGPRQAEQPRQRDVQAQPGQALGQW